MAEERLWNRNFAGLFAANLFLFLANNTLISTVPIHIVQGLGYKDKEVGLAMLMFMLGAILVRPIAGVSADRINGKKVIVASLLCFVATALGLFASSGGLLLLVAIRFLQGICYGLASTCIVYATSLLAPERRKGESMSIFTLSGSLSLVLGPFIGLWLTTRYGMPTVFTVCVAYLAISAAVVSLIRIPRNPRASQAAPRLALSPGRMLEKSALPAAIVYCILCFSIASLQSFVSLYADERGFVEYAKYYFLMLAVVVMVSRIFLGRWFDRYGADVVMYPSMATFVVGLLLLSFADSPFLYLLSAIVIGTGYGTFLPIFQTIAFLRAPEGRKGAASSTILLSYDVGVALGAQLMGAIAEFVGYPLMYRVSAAFVLLAGVLYARWISR